MKVKVNLSNQTLEYMDTQPYIQGTDTRNKLSVYIEHSTIPQTEGAFNIMIAYSLQNGRTTIKMANTGATAETINDVLYDVFYFTAPSVLTSVAGNFVATIILKVNTNLYKVNVLNTVLNSVEFEAFEDALDDTASEVLESLESMAGNITYLQSQVVGVLHNTDIVDNDDSDDPTKVLSARMGKVLAERIGATTSGLVSATYNESTGVLTLTYENDDTYEMKIGLSTTDKSNMADDVENTILADLFETFSTVKSYSTGDFVNYENNIYEFVSDKSSGAWDSTKVVVANLNDYMDEVNTSLANMIETIEGLGNLQPSGTDTSTNILAFNEDKGIYIGTDTGHWYYWNGTQYVDGGVYQATALPDDVVLHNGNTLKDKNNNEIYANSSTLNSETLWEQGGISASNGLYSVSTNRIRLKNYLPNDYYKIVIGATMRMMILAYENNIYIGCWNGSNFVKSTTWLSSVNVSGFKSFNYDIKLVVKYADESNIAPSNYSDIYFIINEYNSYLLSKKDEINLINKNLNAQNLWEQGTINGATGIAIDNTTRIRTKNYLDDKITSIVKNPFYSNYGFGIFAYENDVYVGCWNGTTFVTSVAWLGSIDYYTLRKNNPNYKFKLVMRENSNINITTDVFDRYHLYFDLYNLFSLCDNSNLSNMVNIIYSMLGYGKIINYPTLHKTINVVKHTNIPVDTRTGCTIYKHNNALQLWVFAQGDDVGSYANLYKCNLDVSNNTLTLADTISHNLGHCNTVDYCSDNDTLIMGNGSSDYSLSGKIYIIENVSTKNVLLKEDNIVIDFSSYGTKVNVFWGDNNYGNNNIIYVLTNDTHNIYRVLLGKGDVVLENGTYFETIGFNGTYKILDSYSWGNIIQDYTNVIQDGVFYNNKLVWGFGHQNGNVALHTAELLENGNIKLDGYNYQRVADNGDLSTMGTLGVTKLDDYVLVISGSDLWWCKL